MPLPSIHPATHSVGALLAALTEPFGDLPAVLDAAGSMTFADLDRRTARIGRGLLASGVAKGARVGILMPNSGDFVAALLAVTRVGGVAVLMSTVASGPELAYMIRTADIDTLLMADGYLGKDFTGIVETALPSLAGSARRDRLLIAEAPFLRAIWVWGKRQPGWSSGDETALCDLGEEIGVTPAFAAAAQAEVVPADPAVIIYTSGSTADPKAVVHSQGVLVRKTMVLAELCNYGVGDRVISGFPFFWVGGLGMGLTAVLCSGAAVICPEGPSAEAIAEAFNWEPTHLMMRPDVARQLARFPRYRERAPLLRPSMGPWPRDPELAANSLGMTETLGPHSAFTANLPPDRKGSFGTQVGAIERRIIDPETGREQPAGATGTLSLRGGELMIGMHRREPREVFDVDGFYRTEDLCRIDDDGHLFFFARANDMVKVNGANVAPAEVERAIRAGKGVRDVCVIGMAGADRDETLVAAVVVDGDLTAEDMRDRLKPLLAGYKIPRHFFVYRDDFPMTASQKVDKQQLRREIGHALAERGEQLPASAA